MTFLYLQHFDVKFIIFTSTQPCNVWPSLLRFSVCRIYPRLSFSTRFLPCRDFSDPSPSPVEITYKTHWGKWALSSLDNNNIELCMFVSLYRDAALLCSYIQRLYCVFLFIHFIPVMCIKQWKTFPFRVLTLWFDYGHWPEVNEALVEGIKTIQIDTWLQVRAFLSYPHICTHNTSSVLKPKRMCELAAHQQLSICVNISQKSVEYQ